MWSDVAVALASVLGVALLYRVAWSMFRRWAAEPSADPGPDYSWSEALLAVELEPYPRPVFNNSTGGDPRV